MKKLWTGFKDEWLESFKFLDKEELIEVLQLLVEHKNSGSVDISNCLRTVQAVWSTYQAELDRMADISNKRAESGSQGGRVTQATLNKEEQRLKERALLTFAKANSSKTSVCYTDTDKDTDIEIWDNIQQRSNNNPTKKEVRDRDNDYSNNSISTKEVTSKDLEVYSPEALSRIKLMHISESIQPEIQEFKLKLINSKY